jgi:hypothetical protein
MMGVYIQQLCFIPQLNQIMESTSIFSKDIITPPLVPHGISFTCKSNQTHNGTNFQTFQNDFYTKAEMGQEQFKP